MRNLQHLIQMYERGVVTQMELCSHLVGQTTEDNVGELIALLSSELLGFLKSHVDSRPDTEEKWAQRRYLIFGATEAGLAQVRREQRRGTEILRDVFGTLLERPLPSLAPHVLAWNDGCIVKLATALDAERNFSPEAMGVLADALEEAGCTTEGILSHCRQQGKIHVRGCWLINRILARS